MDKIKKECERGTIRIKAKGDWSEWWREYYKNLQFSIAVLYVTDLKSKMGREKEDG